MYNMYNNTYMYFKLPKYNPNNNIKPERNIHKVIL